MKCAVTAWVIGCLTPLFPQEFRLQNIPIEVTVAGESVENPFFGGFNKPKNQSLDWDDDDDPDFFLLDTDGRLRYYRNAGSPDTPDFVLETTDFQHLPPVSWFYFDDFNGDGLPDLMMQHPIHSSRLMYYENIGGGLLTGVPVNQTDGTPVTSDPFMTPTFADIDNDGDPDFFTGNYVGTVTFYENTGWLEGAPAFQWMNNAWQNISIISAARHGASALQFIDLDDDGDLDLSWGDYFSQSLYIIWNLGSADVPVMDIFNITRSFPENDPVMTAGQNMPGFTDIDGDHDPDLIISVLSGAYGNQMINNLYYYENTGSEGAPDYEFRTNRFLGGLDLLTDTSPVLADIDNDGDLDLFIGNGFEPTAFPWQGRIHFFLNTGTAGIPAWSEEDPEFLGNNLGDNLSPAFADMDNDGDQDVLVGNFNGFLYYFQNTGTPENSTFSGEGVLLQDIDLTGHAVPVLIDLDGDSDPDLVCGETSGDVKWYENIGTPEAFSFLPGVPLVNPAPVSSRSAPWLVDIDEDGDSDLLIGSEYENIAFFRNTGDSHTPVFEADTSLWIPRLGANIKMTGGGFMDSGEYQLIVGNSTGGCYHLAFSPCHSGDINADGATDILDIVFLVSAILENAQLTSHEFCAADLTHDQQVDILDIVMLVSVILNT